MTNITFLLFTLFSLSIAEPKVPYRPQLQQAQVIVTNETEPKTLYNMTEAEINALPLKKKAKLVHLSVKSFKEMTKVVNHESGPKMQDKVLVAAVIFNRVHCDQFRNSVIKVINEPGQFYDVKHTRAGSAKDKKAQLAIVLAYREIKLGKIPHNVLYFNAISYKTKNTKRYKKYKHVNNYYILDTKCKCKWCNGG
jgi:hypothetical protein